MSKENREDVEKFYTGIGSRKTPKEILDLIRRIAIWLNGKGYVLRSGHAIGADLAFEKAVWFDSSNQIFVPWEGYNGSNSKYFHVLEPALKHAEKFHPAWNKLNLSSKLLIARNSYQVLGSRLNKPSRFVICYTLDGKDSGGTGQALRIAKANNIPVMNLYYDEVKKSIFDVLRCLFDDK